MTEPSQDLTSVGPMCFSVSTVSVYGEREIEAHLRGVQLMLKEIITHVESIDYTVRCGLASGCGVLRDIISSDPQVKLLVELCKDRAVAVFILGHMLDLSLRKFDEKYANPLDMAMVTYLYALTTARTDLHAPAILVAKRLKNAHWSAQYCEYFL